MQQHFLLFLPSGHCNYTKKNFPLIIKQKLHYTQAVAYILTYYYVIKSKHIPKSASAIGLALWFYGTENIKTLSTWHYSTSQIYYY